MENSPTNSQSWSYKWYKHLFKVWSFGNKSLIFKNLFKNDVTVKIQCLKNFVSENPPIKSQRWSFKMVWASFLKSLVSQKSLWFLIFDVFCSKMMLQKKVIFCHKKCIWKFSYKESQMVFNYGMDVFPKVCSFANNILNFWRILLKNES